MQVQVNGGRGTVAAAARLRRLAGGGLARGMVAAVDRGTKNADRYGDQEAQGRLPRRGGLARRVAEGTVRRSRIPGGRRLTFDTEGMDLRALDRGRVRHPTFGNRGSWVTQPVRPGYARSAMRRVKADVDRELTAAQRKAVRG
jgi:hypothetical protein